MTRSERVLLNLGKVLAFIILAWVPIVLVALWIASLSHISTQVPWWATLGWVSLTNSLTVAWYDHLWPTKPKP